MVVILDLDLNQKSHKHTYFKMSCLWPIPKLCHLSCFLLLQNVTISYRYIFTPRIMNWKWNDQLCTDRCFKSQLVNWTLYFLFFHSCKDKPDGNIRSRRWKSWRRRRQFQANTNILSSRACIPCLHFCTANSLTKAITVLIGPIQHVFPRS